MHIDLARRGNAARYIEPFRAKAIPVVKDLDVDRGSLDKVIDGWSNMLKEEADELQQTLSKQEPVGQ